VTSDPVTPAERAELERLANAATPGKRTVRNKWEVVAVRRDVGTEEMILSTGGFSSNAHQTAVENVANAEFAAAWDRETCLGLLAALSAAEARADKAEAECEQLRKSLLASERENARWRGCEPVEGDYACGHAAECERLRAGVKRQAEDWAEDHDYLQSLCRAAGVPEAEVTGDGYLVPIRDLADKLAATLRAELDAVAAERRAYERAADMTRKVSVTTCEYMSAPGHHFDDADATLEALAQSFDALAAGPGGTEGKSQ
jgi:hypothetical protein